MKITSLPRSDLLVQNEPTPEQHLELHSILVEGFISTMAHCSISLLRSDLRAGQAEAEAAPGVAWHSSHALHERDLFAEM